MTSAEMKAIDDFIEYPMGSHSKDVCKIKKEFVMSDNTSMSDEVVWTYGFDWLIDWLID